MQKTKNNDQTEKLPDDAGNETGQEKHEKIEFIRRLKKYLLQEKG